MKFKSEIITAASGSIGGTSYLSGKSGLMRQAKPRSTDPSSPQQRAVRASFARLAVAWKEILTDAQRQRWNNYATSSPVLGKFGDPLVLTGHQMFQRCNSIRRLAGKTIVLNGPSKPGLAELPILDIFASAGFGFFGIGFSQTQPWAAETGAALVMFASRWLAKSRNEHRAKLCFAGFKVGGGGPPPGPLILSVNPFNQPTNRTEAGQHWLVTATVMRADGRIGPVESVYKTIT